MLRTRSAPRPANAPSRFTTPRRESWTFLPKVESLEDRCVPAITDMTQLARLFPQHAGPTTLYLNFDGGTASGRTVASYQPQPFRDRALEIRSIVNQVSSIFAPFNVEVKQRTGVGSFDKGTNGNTTIFIGGDSANLNRGMKTPYAFTQFQFLDSPGDYKGYKHRPNSDPFDLAFVDPVGAARDGTWVTQWDTTGIARAVAHEAGHTFGLRHVLSAPQTDVMSYNAANVSFVDQTFSVTDLNYDPSRSPSTYNAGDAFFAKWNDNGTITKLTTQNSYTYLLAALGRNTNQTVVTRNADGRQEVFAVGADHALWHQFELTPNGAWSSWSSFGGYVEKIAVGRSQDGRLQVFALGGDSALHTLWQQTPGGPWTGWVGFGGANIKELAVGSNADGRMDVFVIGGDGALWHREQMWANGDWGPWQTLGGSGLSNLTVTSNSDGRQEVFATGADTALWHKWQVAPNWSWSGWESLGGANLRELKVGRSQDGRLQVFGIGGDYGVWSRWQITPTGGWAGWYAMGGWVKEIAVASNADGRMQIFAIGGDNSVWSLWQVSPNGSWSGWSSLGGSVRQLTVGRRLDGRLDVFATGGDRQLWHRTQGGPYDGWTNWTELGGVLI